MVNGRQLGVWRQKKQATDSFIVNATISQTLLSCWTCRKKASITCIWKWSLGLGAPYQSLGYSSLSSYILLSSEIFMWSHMSTHEYTDTHPYIHTHILAHSRKAASVHASHPHITRARTGRGTCPKYKQINVHSNQLYCQSVTFLFSIVFFAFLFSIDFFPLFFLSILFDNQKELISYVQLFFANREQSQKPLSPSSYSFYLLIRRPQPGEDVAKTPIVSLLETLSFELQSEQNAFLIRRWCHSKWRIVQHIKFKNILTILSNAICSYPWSYMKSLPFLCLDKCLGFLCQKVRN